MSARVWIGVACATMLCANSAAQEDAQSYVELGGNHHSVDSGFGDWSGAYLKGVWRQNPSTAWNGELIRQRAFHDRGTYAAIGITHDLDARSYVTGSLGAGEGEFFFPSLRADASYSYKWLSRAQLVTTVGVGYVDAQDVHRDLSYLGSVAYYFDGPWVVEGGVRVNYSDPGSVSATRRFLALTYGREKERFIVLRTESGDEAYQLVGANQTLVNFSSNQQSVSWREWFAPRTGFQLQLERYDNPFYERRGLVAGIFQDF
jgi:YaiO family outer membrane protein